MINFFETKRIKKLLQQNPEAFRETIEDTSLGICITNSARAYVAVNTPFCHIHGYAPGELIGQSFTLLVLPEQRDQMKRTHDNFMKLRFELVPTSIALTKSGQKLQISTDTSYSDKILNAPHKITFVHKDAILEE
jgi:PAS domain S-box-containing protein